MPESLHDASYVVIDFETTGLSPAHGSEVVETGAVCLVKRRITETFQRLSRPAAPIPVAVTRIHGITDEMVREEEPFSAVLPELLDFLGDKIVVAHNAPFDYSFLRAALEQTGRLALTNPVLDTVRLSRRLFPEFPRHDLETLCREHGIHRERGHRALDDARATAELLGILLERAQENGVGTREELLRVGGSSRRERPRQGQTEPEARAAEE